jgi:outer membrane protein
MIRFLFCICIATLSARAEMPLTLNQAREFSLKTHPKITAADLRALAAKQVVTESRSSYFPTVVANATAVGTAEDNARIGAGALSNPAIFDRNGDGITITQIITDFGRTANLAAGAKLRAGAELANSLAVRDQIVLLVDNAYFDALRSAALLNVAEQTLSTRQLLFEQVSALASNKLKSELDVNFAQVNVDDAKLLKLQAQNDLQAAEARLSTLIGQDQSNHYLLEDTPDPLSVPPGPSGLVASALARRPDLEQARLEGEAAARLARAERAARYPTLTAIGTAGVIPVHSGQFSDEYAVAGVNLSIPLFAGGLYSAKEREAKLRAEAAKANVKDLENNVIRDVKIAALSAQTAYERISVTQRLLDHATQAYNLAEVKYRVGGSSIVELSQAQLNKTAAEIAHTAARYNYEIQLSILNFQTGAANSALTLEPRP